MFKVFLIVVVTLAAVAIAQESPVGEQNAAPEPYAYAYQTDSSSASEQRSPDGKVTGYYTITDPTDGRERRVEYYADETGFHAKVATNELGTKSENSAGVEISASPPTEAQLAFYQSGTQQVQYKQQQFVQQQQAPAQVSYSSSVSQQVPTSQQVRYSTYTQQQTPVVSYQPSSGSQRTVSYFQQQPGYSVQYGYAPGYAQGYTNQYSTNSGQYGYGLQGGSYNYHLPAQYYSNVQGGTNQRYVTNQVQPAGGSVYKYSSSSVRTVPVGGSQYTYSSGVVPGSSTRTSYSSSSSSSGQPANLGSGNLLLLKK